MEAIMKRTFLFVLLVVAICCQSRAELSLVVRPLTGADKVTALHSIGKLVYSGDSLYLYDVRQALIYQEELVKVGHVRYSDERPPIEVDDKQNVAAQVAVYPNPTADVLYIDKVEAEEVRLYTSDGRLLQVIEATEGRVEVDMLAYPIGAYVLFCGGEVFTVIKK